MQHAPQGNGRCWALTTSIEVLLEGIPCLDYCIYIHELLEANGDRKSGVTCVNEKIGAEGSFSKPNRTDLPCCFYPTTVHPVLAIQSAVAP